MKSSIGFSCCIRVTDVDNSQTSPSSTWIRSKAQDLPDIRGKCRGFMSRIGKNGNRRHHNSTDFRYDPFSYALNFDEGPDFDEEGEISPDGYRYRSFSSRLRASSSPQPTSTATAVVVVSVPTSRRESGGGR